MDHYRAIENLLYTYARLIDAGNLEAMADLFSEAQFLGPDGSVVAEGKEQYLALHRRLVKIYEGTGTPCTKHVITNAIIEVGEAADSAVAESYFTVFQATDILPLQPIIAGRYQDTFVRNDGIWRFNSRQTIPELYGDLSQHLMFDIAER
tara:strand:- start:216498 stop:216947 length:450 start_codon:yes stop_codon:yes gene_type:complete